MGSPHAQAWAQAMEVEKRLKSESRKRSFWDPEIRRLRLALQQAYEAVVFANYEFAVVRAWAASGAAGMGAWRGRLPGAHGRGAWREGMHEQHMAHALQGRAAKPKEVPSCL